MKFIVVLLLTTIATVSLGSFVKKYKTQNKPILVSPLVAGSSTTSTPSVFGWQVFTNNYYGYKINHPADINVKNQRNGDISLEKSKLINIFITQDVLPENDTVNTVIENTINNKTSQLKNNYVLVNTISPIAMGSATAQTYTSSENGKNITYYYIPQKDKKFLLITNFTPQNSSADYLTSEDIIYSLELLP